MVSLLKLARVTEEGVRFLSPHDGTPMYVLFSSPTSVQMFVLIGIRMSDLTIIRLLTPEHSISLQNSIGSDIMMQLDDVIATTSPDLERMREAMERSVRWLDRCIDAHKYPEKQNLFCIIQGGLDLDLRRKCCEEMVARDTPGIAIGGLSGGEAKDEFCKVYAFFSVVCTGVMCYCQLTISKGGYMYRSSPRSQAQIRDGSGKCGDSFWIIVTRHSFISM